MSGAVPDCYFFQSNFCVSKVKRSCVHFVTLDQGIIPFDIYNLLYRDGQIDAHRQRAEYFTKLII